MLCGQTLICQGSILSLPDLPVAATGQHRLTGYMLILKILTLKGYIMIRDLLDLLLQESRKTLNIAFDDNAYKITVLTIAVYLCLC